MFNSILVAVDGSDHARKALRIAADVAKLYGRKLDIVHVVTGKKTSDELRHMAEVEHLVDTPDSSTPRAGNVPGQMNYLLGEVALHENVERVATAVGEQVLGEAANEIRDSHEIGVNTHLEHGDPASRILELATRNDVDLLVLGNRGLSAVEGLFAGSVSTRVRHAAECTCLTVT